MLALLVEMCYGLPACHEYFRKQRSLDFLSLNKSFAFTLKLAFTLREGMLTQHTAENVLCGTVVSSATSPRQRPDQWHQAELWSGLSVHVYGLARYSLACLSPICASDDAPVSVMLPNGPLMAFP